MYISRLPSQCTVRVIDGRLFKFYRRQVGSSVNKTLVLANSQPPTSQPLALHRTLLPHTNSKYQFTDPETMIAWLANANS